MFLRRLDPRLDPSLRPEQWAEATRRVRVRLAVALALVLLAVGALAFYLWYPFDRTKGMTPEAVVKAAGMAVLNAKGYRFAIRLTGESADELFPTAELEGQVQVRPKVVHLAGDVTSGESQIGLEYYLDGRDTYVKRPGQDTWMFIQGFQPEELTSFMPDNLAAPLIGGVRGVEEVGRERLSRGSAVVYRLDLDPRVMLPQLENVREDRQVDYLLWVYTRNLKPARLLISVKENPEVEDEREVDQFTYKLDLDFKGLKPLRVPIDIKSRAREDEQVPPSDPVEEPAESGN